MLKTNIRSAGIALLLVFIAGISILEEASAQVFCQCVGYVANVTGLNLNRAYASQMGSIFEENKYIKVSTPQPGDVAIMQSNFRGADSTAGHIGFVENTHTDQGNTYINLKGTNQPGIRSTANGCTNVSTWNVSEPVIVNGNPNSSIAFHIV